MDECEVKYESLDAIDTIKARKLKIPLPKNPRLTSGPRAVTPLPVRH